MNPEIRVLNEEYNCESFDPNSKSCCWDELSFHENAKDYQFSPISNRCTCGPGVCEAGRSSENQNDFQTNNIVNNESCTKCGIRLDVPDAEPNASQQSNNTHDDTYLWQERKSINLATMLQLKESIDKLTTAVQEQGSRANVTTKRSKQNPGETSITDCKDYSHQVQCRLILLIL